LTLWCLFFLISFGLGYPTLNRYDPRELGEDWQVYYKMVTNEAAPDDIPFVGRILVPEVAKPFYLLAKGRVRSWNPVFFGLLISNCLFCASAVFLLLLVGLRVLRDLPLALLGCTLYMLNFVVHNLWLSGMVDSSEACLLMAVTWSLFSGRWWLLPLIAIPGGIAKQSFVPFSTLFAAVWWMTAERSNRSYRRLVWIAALGVVSTISMVLAQRAASGEIVSPTAMVGWWNTGNHFALNIANGLRDQQFWYAFIWLLPLGVWRLGRLPMPWVMASAITALFALCLGGYANLLGTVNRPLFNVMGPILSLSAAMLIGGEPWQSSNQSGAQTVRPSQPH
jgi:hypothetical protein